MKTQYWQRVAVAFLGEIIVQVGSVTLGQGKPLLPRQITGAAALRLVSVQRIGPGFAELGYEVPALP